MDDIWQSIRASRVVVAEMTGKNANVFYEVGLAQAIGKPVIILTRDESDVPFDLKALRYLYYDVQNPFWGQDLKSQLRAMIETALSEQALSSYLEGIAVIEPLVYPKPVVSEPSENGGPEVPDLVGIWHTKDESEGDSRPLERTLNLSQDGSRLSGLEAITYFVGQTPTVVQQSLTGTVVANKVTLNGVNYTFVRRGEATGWDLDNYEFELSDDFSQMTGQNNPTPGAELDVVFMRTARDPSTKGDL